MRNLKKFLALVLALMMVVSVMITVSAKEYTDEKDVKAIYKTAVDTLTNIGVFKGTSDTEFSPTKEITRAEVAAIIYRIMTGDVDDDYVEQYRGYENGFSDVTAGSWYEPYVNYCANARLLVGDGKGHFMPSKKIDGYQVLAVLLRCVGYDQPGEFEGSNWTIHTAQIATQRGITQGLEAELSDILKRQEVAFLTYMAAVKANRVWYTPAYSYQEDDEPLITVPTESTTFDLDEWGEPKDGTNKATFNYPLTDVTKEYDVPAPEPVKEYWEAKDHCDVAKDLSLTKDQEFTVYTNGKENSSKLTLKALSETDMVGAQGRYTAIYKIGSTYSIVYKDTLLVKVTDVKAATFDKNDHLKTEATLDLEVYDAKGATKWTEPALKNGKTDWTYTKGEYLLVNYHQASKTSDKAVSTFDKDNNEDKTTDWKDYYTFLGNPETFEGAQTLVSSNANKHTIDGTAYNDNNRYALDEAGKTMKVPFTWYKDTQGNIIGSTAISPENGYGVINRIWAVNSNNDGSTTVKAAVTYMNGDTATINVGNLVYFTGTAGNALVPAGTDLEGGKATYTDSKANVVMRGTDKKNFYVSDSFDTNKAEDKGKNDIIAGHMFKIVPSTDVKGAYDFIEVAGAGSKDDLKITKSDANGVLSELNFKGLGNASTDIESGKAANGAVKVDNNTVFLIRSTDPETQEYVYTTKTGYKAISDYKSDEVDYVNCDDDAAAEYVYIIAGEKKDEGWHLFFAASTESDKDGKALVNVDDNGKTYTVHGYLDGEEGTVVIRKDQKGWAGVSGEGTDPTKWVGANIGAVLGSGTNGNTLWMVYIQDGVVIDINGSLVQQSTSEMLSVAEYAKTELGANYSKGVAFADKTAANKHLGMLNRNTEPYGTDGSDASEIEDYLGIYADQSIMITTVKTDIDVDESGTIDLGSSLTLSVDGDPVVGKWSDLATAATYHQTVIVVYDDAETITQAYIIDAPKAATPATPTDVDADYVSIYDAPINEILVSKDVTEGTNIYQLIETALTNKFPKATSIKVDVATNKATVVDGTVTYTYNIYPDRASVKLYSEKKGDYVTIGAVKGGANMKLADIVKAENITLKAGQALEFKGKLSGGGDEVTKIYNATATGTPDIKDTVLVLKNETVKLRIVDAEEAVSGAVEDAIAAAVDTDEEVFTPTKDNADGLKDAIKEAVEEMGSVTSETVDTIVDAVLDQMKDNKQNVKAYNEAKAEAGEKTGDVNNQESLLSDVVNGLIEGASEPADKIAAVKAYVDWFFDIVDDGDAAATYGFQFEGVELSKSGSTYTVKVDSAKLKEGNIVAGCNGLAAVTNKLDGITKEWSWKVTAPTAAVTESTKIDSAGKLNFGNAIGTLATTQLKGNYAGTTVTLTLTATDASSKAVLGTFSVNYVYSAAAKA